MDAMKCKMCNSNQFTKEESYWVCQHCGTRYTNEEAKLLRVQIDRTGDLNNLLQLARRARQTQNANDGYTYYRQVATIDPQNWEAFFYSVYFQSLLSYKQDLYVAASTLVKSIGPSLKLLSTSVTDSSEVHSILNQMLSDLCVIADNCADSIFDRINYARSFLYDRDPSHHGLEKWGDECRRIVPLIESSFDILYAFGDGVLSYFGNSMSQYAIEAYKVNVKSHEETVRKMGSTFADGSKQKMLSYCGKIKQYDPSFIPPAQPKSGGCYIATAVYGNYDCPQVWTLRRFRDYQLAETWYGRVFIKLYYAVSPTLVKQFGGKAWFTRFWRTKLDKMVKRLQNKGFDSSPYNDRTYK